MNRFDDTMSHEKRLELCHSRRQEIDKILTISMREAEKLDERDGLPKDTKCGHYLEENYRGSGVSDEYPSFYIDRFGDKRGVGGYWGDDTYYDEDNIGCGYRCHLCDSDTCEIRIVPYIESEAEWVKYKKSWHKDLVRAEKRILKRLEKRYKQPYVWQL